MRPETTGKRARRRFTPEFKAGAARLVLDEGKTIGAVARKLELFDYIEVFYNQRRRHSTLGQISPAEYERRTQAA